MREAAPGSTLAIALATMVAGTGCTTDPIAPRDVAPHASAPPARDAGDSQHELPAAMWNSEAISFAQMRPRLLEAAGGSILDELLLERALERELAIKSIVIDQGAIAAEESAALDALSTDRARAEQLLDRLKSLQGMGSVRWKALLSRNAGLRALARRSSVISEENVRQAYDARHGPRRSARLIVVADLAQAQSARGKLDAGTPFGEVAATASTDASAARGGLIAPLCRLDPSYPLAVREALFALAPGARSDPILIDGGYAILEMREEVPGDGADPASVRGACEVAARAAQERVEMDRIARTLLRDARPTIFDPSLEEAWRRQVEARRD